MNLRHTHRSAKATASHDDPTDSSPSPDRAIPNEKESIDQYAADPESHIDFSHINQKEVLRKMDLRLIPMLALLYLLSFLDRGNIGNARIEGLVEDLNMTGPQYNWCCKFCVPIPFSAGVLVFQYISRINLVIEFSYFLDFSLSLAIYYDISLAVCLYDN